MRSLLTLTAISILLSGCASTKGRLEQVNVATKPAASPATLSPTPLEKVSQSIEHGLEWVVWIPNTLFSRGALLEITTAVGNIFILPVTNRAVTSGTVPSFTQEK